MPDLGFLLVAGLAAGLGAIVQSGVGLGLGLVAAPVVTMFYPSLMPGAMLVAATVLPLFTLPREFRDADWHGLRWAFTGRVAGTPIGVFVVAVLPTRVLGAAVGGMVLAAIGGTLWSGRVPRNAGTLTGAGLLAGAASTATSIGGPPLAVLYQREEGALIRSTLGIFFTVGALISLLTLGAVGQLPQRQLVAGLALTPFVFAGFAVSGPLRRYLDQGRMRAGVLVITGLSAVVLIVRSVM